MKQEHFLIELPQLSNLYDEQKMWEEKDLYDHHVNEHYGVECWQVPIPTNIKYNLNLDNLPHLIECGSVDEVSIGHAIITDALKFGFEDTIMKYIKVVRKSH